MDDMAKSVLKYLGYLFAMLVLGFTGFQTWSLLYGISNSPVISVLGLVLFEGGMLYWWAFFQKEADGLPQMGLSLLVAIFGLLLVGGATALHLGAVEADLLGPDMPARLVTIAAIVNLVAKFLMPLLHPDVMKQTYKKALMGKVMSQTFNQFETKVKSIAAQLADEVAEDWKNEMRQEVLSLQMSRPKLLPSEDEQPPDKKETVRPVEAVPFAEPVPIVAGLNGNAPLDASPDAPLSGK